MMGAGKILCNRYHVGEKIGQGGMQEVFTAVDQNIGKPVAVKTPLQGSTKRRFKQSAILAARINNHGVAKTLDYFEVEGTPFLVEELIEGDTLDKAILDKHRYFSTKAVLLKKQPC